MDTYLVVLRESAQMTGPMAGGKPFGYISTGVAGISQTVDMDYASYRGCPA